MPAMYCIYL